MCHVKIKQKKHTMPGCVRQYTKKYSLRPSPPFPANKCCWQKKKGNDGNLYVSTPNTNGICTWKPLHSKSRSRPKSSRKSKPKSRRRRSKSSRKPSKTRKTRKSSRKSKTKSRRRHRRR